MKLLTPASAIGVRNRFILCASQRRGPIGLWKIVSIATGWDPKQTQQWLFFLHLLELLLGTSGASSSQVLTTPKTDTGQFFRVWPSLMGILCSRHSIRIWSFGSALPTQNKMKQIKTNYALEQLFLFRYSSDECSCSLNLWLCKNRRLHVRVEESSMT